MMLNLCHFVREEIDVIVESNNVVIRGAHKELEDEHGHIKRTFTRSYPLPEGTEIKNVNCTWSRDGILTIVTSYKAAEIVIPTVINYGRY